MPRLLFEKTGRGVWISHLDLMRLFQRAFKRAGLPLTHTQGFNPRPSVSIALPLSVGVESICELLDFDLDGQTVPNDEIAERLNRALVDGVKILQVYDKVQKINAISQLNCVVTLEYDDGIPQGAEESIAALFAQKSLIVPKKTKSGIQNQDIIPMIRRIRVDRIDAHTIELDAMICCQNPTLNPAQLASAVEMHLPQFKASFTKSRRIEIYDKEEKVFR